MKTHILFGTAVLLATSLFAAEPKDDVSAAVKKLADANGYSWRSTTEAGGGGGGAFRPGPTDGKAAKDGTIQLALTRGETTTEAVLKGDKGAIKTDAGWQSLAEATADTGDSQPSRGRFLARMLRNYKAPAVQAQDLVAKVKGLKKSGDAYEGELTEDGAKEMLTFGGRGGTGAGPSVSNAKGSVKFWVRDGLLSKYELHLQGTMSFGGNDRDVDRTTTVEIKDVGKTTVTVPEEAKKKLS